jgi:DNA-directed RNA polymerase subunit RPC12/RpoP
MSQQTLKELFKPPFRFVEGGIYDRNERVITLLDDGVGELIAAALNEKWERDFGERKKWRFDNDYGYRGIICPDCSAEYECFYEDIEDVYKFCPYCGQRLLPPERIQTK